jgi:hypothetical protein
MKPLHNSLSLWERDGVRVGHNPRYVCFTNICPHPNLLPKGEEISSRQICIYLNINEGIIIFINVQVQNNVRPESAYNRMTSLLHCVTTVQYDQPAIVVAGT